MIKTSIQQAKKNLNLTKYVLGLKSLTPVERDILQGKYSYKKYKHFIFKSKTADLFEELKKFISGTNTYIGSLKDKNIAAHFSASVQVISEPILSDRLLIKRAKNEANRLLRNEEYLKKVELEAQAREIPPALLSKAGAEKLIAALKKMHQIKG